MKRSDLQVGQELALASSNDWADGGEYGIRKVIVVDTRPFSARRGGYGKTYPDFTLEDGSTAPGYWVVSPGKTTCLVRDAKNEVQIVPISQLRGNYDACLLLVQTRTRARQESAARIEAYKQSARERTQAAAKTLKDLGVPVGYISDYQESLPLGPAALEAIVALLQKGGE